MQRGLFEWSVDQAVRESLIGFDVAFKMFDEDGNKQIDYEEFKLLGQGLHWNNYFRSEIQPEVGLIYRKWEKVCEPDKKKFSVKMKVL